MFPRLTLVFALAASSALAGPSGYHLAQSVAIGGDTFWDYVFYDAAHHHIFLSHGSHVVVVDSETYKVVGDIPDTQGVHGTAVAGDRGFITAGAANSVVMFDADTLKVTGTVAVGMRPDSILYDPASNRVFTFNGGSKDSTAIDASTGMVIGAIALGGKPEAPAADGKGLIYDNIENTSEIVAIDAKSMTVVKRWSVAPCTEPSGLAIDTAHGRLFAACDNAMMAAVDVKTGKVVATVPTGKGSDGAGYDPGAGDVLIPNGEGKLTVIHEDTPDKYTLVENVPTQFGARTMDLDPATHRVFTVTADLTPDPGKQPPYKMTPGSFRLLVLGH
ncbi:MAG TPA: YncE family protein [Rhizomicrobium sp.]|jgi:DNA-binding beta-propeller fold protein YncE